MDKTVTFRLPREITNRAKRVMQKRGILKISDFVRQALVAELNRSEEPQFATAGPKAKQEQEAPK